MKNILLSSFILLLFSISVLLFQVSCQKEVFAQSSNYVLPPATSSTLGGIIVGSGLSITSSGVLSVNTTSSNSELIVYCKRNSGVREIWTANTTGGNQKRVPISLPTGYLLKEGGEVRLSSDRSTIFFTAGNTTTSTSIFSCSIDGSNVKKLIDECDYYFDIK